MKSLIALLIAIPFCVSAQKFKPIILDPLGKEPLWCLFPQLDSVKMDLNKTYINYKDLKKLNVLDEPSFATLKLYKGAGIIAEFKSKPEFVPLKAIRFKHQDKYLNNTQRKLYVIDGLPVEDTSGIKIDPLAVKSAIVFNAADSTLIWCTPPALVYVINTNKPQIKHPKKRKS